MEKIERLISLQKKYSDEEDYYCDLVIFGPKKDRKFNEKMRHESMLLFLAVSEEILKESRSYARRKK